MKIKLLTVKYKDSKPGDVLDVSREEGEYLCKSNLAKKMQPKPNKKAANKKKGDE